MTSGKLISAEKKAEVRRLWEQGLSYRVIAEITGLSYRSVYNITKGKN